jgi:hypothetical protein
MGWFLKSVIAMVLLIVIPFATSVLQNKFKVPAEVTLVWWMIGVGLGVSLLSFFKGYASIMFSTKPILIAGGLAITIGVLANAFLFQAFASCPNPGIPMAIISANAILAVVLTKWLPGLFPQYFSYLNFSWAHLVGAVLIVSGVVVIRLWG